MELSLIEPLMTTGALLARVADGSAAGLDSVRFLSRVDPGELDGAARVELVRAIERCRAALDGLQHAAMASVADAIGGLGRPVEEARHEIGAALGLTPNAAGHRLSAALELRDRLPDTLAMLQAGELGSRQARQLAEAVRELPDPLASQVEARVLPRAPGQTSKAAPTPPGPP